MGNMSVHLDDWQVLRSTVEWIWANASKDARPFFVYQGMNIVHPPYRTNELWFGKVNQSKLRVPKWEPLEAMHPCDFQSSMLKGCIPPRSTEAGSYFYDEKHRLHIRTIYLAMVAEFDAMVGEYVRAVKDSGKYSNTVFIVTSDHGDMQMEHQQFYKMVPYDASSRVPMVVMDARSRLNERRVADVVTQLIDVYPSVLEYARVPRSRWPQLDGSPLQPLCKAALRADGSAQPHRAPPGRPDFVVSQFHGDNIAMSWFLVVHDSLKLVVWGTGEQHPHQLFNLTADPDESVNLGGQAEMQGHVRLLLDKLRSVVDFAAVARNVAQYEYDSMRHWINATPSWQAEMGKSKIMGRREITNKNVFIREFLGDS